MYNKERERERERELNEREGYERQSCSAHAIIKAAESWVYKEACTCTARMVFLLPKSEFDRALGPHVSEYNLLTKAKAY